MVIYFVNRSKARQFAKSRTDKNLPGKVVDGGKEFKASGHKHSRYGVALR